MPGSEEEEQEGEAPLAAGLFRLGGSFPGRRNFLERRRTALVPGVNIPAASGCSVQQSPRCSERPSRPARKEGRHEAWHTTAPRHQFAVRKMEL